MPDAKSPNPILVYGSNWCPHTMRMLHKLDALKIAYLYVDVDENPAAEQRIAAWNNGRAIRPTLDIDGDIFVHPEGAQLDAELQKRGLLPPP